MNRRNNAKDRIIRLVRLVMLVQSSKGLTARELSQKLEVTERTIYRDLEVISAAYVPIVNVGKGGGYQWIGQ